LKEKNYVRNYKMNKIKLLIITIVINLAFVSFAYAETIKFSVGNWEGDTKKGKAHGKGVLTFDNGLIYEGKMSKNKIHGVGKLTTLDGEVYEGKWKWGKFYNKLDKKTRKVIELGTTGRYFWVRHEVRGKDTVSRQWFPAEEKNGSYVLSAAGEKQMNAAIKKKKGDAVKGAAC